jgi:choline dehydrogenase
VEIFTEDTARTIQATREVILAAGTIHSAKLLMLSGVGDAVELRKLGIIPVANLRGVPEPARPRARLRRGLSIQGQYH